MLANSDVYHAPSSKKYMSKYPSNSGDYISMADFDIKLEENQIAEKLAGTTLKVKNILKKCLTAANSEVLKIAKQNIKTNFSTHNNENDEHNPPLLKSLKKWNTKGNDFSSYVASRSLHGAVMEKGVDIHAKGDGWLTFKVDGEWKKVKAVSIPARPFLRPAVDAIYSTGKYKESFDRIIDKELKKYWDKKAKENN